MRRATIICALAALVLTGAPRAWAQDARSFNLGMRLLQTGEKELALKAFQRSIAKGGVNAAALSAMAATLYRLGRHREALQFAESAVDLDPNLAVARNNLGVMFYDSGDYHAARAEFERAYALTEGLEPKVATNLGIAEFSASRRAVAVEAERAEFDVIQYGHGAFRVEPRKPDPGQDPAPTEEDPT